MAQPLYMAEGNAVFHRAVMLETGRIKMGFRLCTVDDDVVADEGEASPAELIAAALNAYLSSE